MTDVLDDRKGLRKAAEILGFRLRALGHDIEPDDEAALIAAVAGARDWAQLGRFLDEGSPTVPFRPDRHDDLRTELALRLNAAAGIPEDDAFLALEAMPGFVVADVASFALDRLEAFLVRRPVDRFGPRMVEFLGRHPALADEIDVALRLRAAGKAENGIAAALDERSLDVMDILEEHPNVTPLALAALFYAVPSNLTAGYAGLVGKILDGHPDLPDDTDKQRGLIVLLSLLMDGPADFRFSHLFVSDMLGLPEGLPMPSSVQELRHAIAYHGRVAPVLDELFACDRPFEVLVGGDLDGASANPWEDLNIAVAASLRRSRPGAAFENVADFVNAYDTKPGAESHEVNYAIYGRGILRFLSDCEALADASDADVAALVESDDNPFSLSDLDGDGDRMETAAGRFSEGRKPRRRRAKPSYRPGEMNPEDAERVKRLGEEVGSIVGVSARTRYGI